MTETPSGFAAMNGSDVRVKTPGPVTSLTGLKTAVWPGDSVRILARVGSRRECRVTYRHGECVSSFTALVPNAESSNGAGGASND